MVKQIPLFDTRLNAFSREGYHPPQGVFVEFKPLEGVTRTGFTALLSYAPPGSRDETVFVTSDDIGPRSVYFANQVESWAEASGASYLATLDVTEALVSKAGLWRLLRPSDYVHRMVTRHVKINAPKTMWERFVWKNIVRAPLEVHIDPVTMDHSFYTNCLLEYTGLSKKDLTGSTLDSIIFDRDEYRLLKVLRCLGSNVYECSVTRIESPSL